MTLSAWAAIDTYIRIVGVDGTSKDPAHLNWITVSSVAAQDLNGDAQADRESVDALFRSLKPRAVRKATPAPGSGAGPGKAKAADVATGQAAGKRIHKPFTITKEIDKASPLLAQACASGKHFPEVDVDLGSGHYKLSDVVISSDTKSAAAIAQSRRSPSRIRRSR